MKRGCLLLLAVWLCRLAAQESPVLMHIDGKAVPLAEFEYACRHHALPEAQDSLQARLEWFVGRKLKALAAESVGLDTLPAFRNALDRYRHRLVQTYLTDTAALEQAARAQYEAWRQKQPSGSVLVSHIFRYLPQNVSATALRRTEAQMDSIYGALCRGADFGQCVQRFSDEKAPFRMNRLDMPVEFEEVAFSLQPGSFSRPFFTPQGIHIVRVLERSPLPPFGDVKERLMQELCRTRHTDASTKAVVEKLKAAYRFTPDPEGTAELLRQGHTERTLFTLDGQPYDGADFDLFASAHPAATARQLEGFVAKSVLDRANARIGQQHPEAGLCLQVYRDSLLACALEQQEGWDDGESEQQLQAYFKKHCARYRWEHPRYKGVVLHGTGKRLVRQARKFLKKLPEEEWADAVRMAFAPEESGIKAEMGTFKPGDNAYVDNLVFRQAEAASLPSHPFTAVVGKKLNGPENYREVYPRLVADFRRDAQIQRMAQLYARSKVEINQEVLKTVKNQ